MGTPALELGFGRRAARWFGARDWSAHCGKSSRGIEMATAGLQQITVWLDELAPDQGTFAHALEWATMLHLPLHGLVSTGRERWPLRDKTVAACELACGRVGATWSCTLEEPDRDPERWSPGELRVMGGAMPASIQRRLFRDAVSRPGVGPLLCPRSWEYLRRAMVINEGRTAGSGFLEAAASVCRDVAHPVAVLTLARNGEDARRRQQLAEDVFAEHGVKADFHVIVGGDFNGGVSVVANWRRCSLVLVEKISAPFARRWMARSSSDHLLDLSDTFSFLPIAASAPPRPTRVQEPKHESLVNGAGPPAAFH
jgi:hypothetical protein